MKTRLMRCLKCNGVVKVLFPKGTTPTAPADCRRCEP